MAGFESRSSELVSWLHKGPKTGSLGQRNCVFSQHRGWNSEMELSTGVFLLRPLWVAWRRPSSPSASCHRPSVPVWVLISSCKSSCHTGLGPTLMASTNLITSLKPLIPNPVGDAKDLGFHHVGWGRGHNSAHNI